MKEKEVKENSPISCYNSLKKIVRMTREVKDSSIDIHVLESGSGKNGSGIGTVQQ